MDSESGDILSMAICMMIVPAIGTFFAFYFGNEASNRARMDPDSELGQEQQRRANRLMILGAVLLTITLGMCTCTGLMAG